MRPHDLTTGILAQAARLGFVGAAVTNSAVPRRGPHAVSQWLAAGYHGEMDYMHTARQSPEDLSSGAQSVIVVALAHPRPHTQAPIARYARGEDYHRVMRDKLEQLARACESMAGRPVTARACVDTAPLLEREHAARAGLGFFGKNTLTILPGVGSYVLLGELIVDLELEAGTPAEPRCGSCTLCLDACPTGAFVGPYELDARRCISYLTIELRGPIPRDLRAGIGGRVFGCDVCQEVCPFNRGRRVPQTDPRLAARRELDNPSLVDLLELTSSGYRRLVRGTALSRVSRHRLARNAAVALGNRATGQTEVQALARAVRDHISPLVRGHAAWALGRIGTAPARDGLAHGRSDDDSFVREEIQLALADTATEPDEPSVEGS